MNTWRSLVYFVAAPRKDGTAPDIVKAIGSQIFYSYEDAECFRIEQSELVNYEFKVFYAMVDTPRCKPCTGEVSNTDV